MFVCISVCLCMCVLCVVCCALWTQKDWGNRQSLCCPALVDTKHNVMSHPIVACCIENTHTAPAVSHMGHRHHVSPQRRQLRCCIIDQQLFLVSLTYRAVRREKTISLTSHETLLLSWNDKNFIFVPANKPKEVRKKVNENYLTKHLNSLFLLLFVYNIKDTLIKRQKFFIFISYFLSIIQTVLFCVPLNRFSFTFWQFLFGNSSLPNQPLRLQLWLELFIHEVDGPLRSLAPGRLRDDLLGYSGCRLCGTSLLSAKTDNGSSLGHVWLH